jgi:hypothetical protein
MIKPAFRYLYNFSMYVYLSTFFNAWLCVDILIGRPMDACHLCRGNSAAD